MIHCRIIYQDSKIAVEYLPGCLNFSSWLHEKISNKRWHSREGLKGDPKDKTPWVVCNEITEEEAKYVEMLAISQWGEGSCEVIGRPGEAKAIKPEAIIIPEKEDVQEEGQLSLF